MTSDPRSNPISSGIDSFKSSSEVRRLVMAHSQIHFRNAAAALVMNWVLIIGTLFLVDEMIAGPADLALKIAAYVVGTIVIACRQHALLVLMHEASHFRLSKNVRLNDTVGELFAAFPTMASLTWYRKHHLVHHRETNTDQDPDWVRKIPLAEWQYPKSAKQLRFVLLKQLLRGGWDWLKFVTSISNGDRRRTVFWIVAFAGAVGSGHIREFSLYWMVPMLVVFPVIQRLRSIAEHFGLPNTHELNGTRNTVASAAETFLLSPHGVNFHLTHHLFPSVPFYNLAKLHRRLMEFEIYRQHAHVNDSFLFGENSVWSDLKTHGTHPIDTAVKVSTAPDRAA